MSDYKMLSSDSHVVEPPDLWEKRIDPKFRDRAPYLAHEEDGDQWYADGVMFGSTGVAGQAGQRFEDGSKLHWKGRYEEDIPLGGFDPHAHVKDLDADHIVADVLYPTQGLSVWLVPDGELLSAIFRAYNDWMADFCGPYPDRLKGIGMVNVDDVAEGVEELKRCAQMGMAGAMIPTGPFVRYDDPRYEPLWATAQDLDMPLSLHIGCLRARRGDQLPDVNVDAVEFLLLDFTMQKALSSIILSGVFERYPRLKVAAVEFEASWAPYFMRKLDDCYKNRVAGYSHMAHRFKEGFLPSDFFRSNVYISFQEDDLLLPLRHEIGVDNLMWGSDYPHAESTFPFSKSVVERILEGIPDDEKAKIAGLNTARLYNLNPS